MKVWLITSRVTFVPNNYTHIVQKCSEHPDFEGLILIDNFSWSWPAKALVLILTGAAPRLGWHLLKNCFDSSWKKKELYFKNHGKRTFIVKDINSAEFLNSFASEHIDLIVNARTRSFFRKKILNIPRLGCINIHHGLLPDQRGLMCDFWNRANEKETGFTIHQMTSKLDDGAILKAVSTFPNSKDYLACAEQGEFLEFEALQELLKIWSQGKTPAAIENKQLIEQPHFKNPGLMDFYWARFKKKVIL